MTMYRATSWWLVWDDLKWPDPDVYDKIRRRADLMQRSNVNLGIIFGSHFRWDFLPIWDCLHDLIATIADELHQRDIQLFDHHSCTLVHRHGTREDMRNVKNHSGPHLPFSPSRQAAASWEYEGRRLNDWRMIHTRTGEVLYQPFYTAEEFCFNNPEFIQAYQGYVRYLLSETGIDGLMCDDAIYFNGYTSCGCSCCRSRFRREYGHELPGPDDRSFWGNWENPAWRDWIEMRFRSNGDFLLQVKNVLPEGFPFLSCCSGSSFGAHNNTGADVQQFVRSCTIVHLEMAGNIIPVDDPETWNKPIAHKLVMASHHLAAAEKKDLPCLGAGYGLSKDSAHLVWAVNKMLGSCSWYSMLKGRLGLPDSKIAHLPDDAEAAARAYTFEKEHESLFRGRLVSDVGVYFSYNTRNNSLFGNARPGFETDYFDTLTYLLAHGRTPRTALEIPENADQIRVLLMPSALCLSGEERERIRAYLAAGGILLATGPIGLKPGRNDEPLEPFLSGYGIDVEFTESATPEDFWPNQHMREVTFEPCRNEMRWHEPAPNFFWHPARLQDADPSMGLASRLSDVVLAPPVEVVHAPGWLSTLHALEATGDRYVLHLLAAEYDAIMDEELEAQRKHRTRVNLIEKAIPKNAAREIVLKMPGATEDVEVYAPFEDNPVSCEREGDTLTISPPETCSYLLVAAQNWK